MTYLFETDLENHIATNDTITAILESMPMGILLFTNSLIKHENGLGFFNTIDIISFSISAVTITKYMVILITKLLQADAEILDY